MLDAPKALDLQQLCCQHGFLTSDLQCVIASVTFPRAVSTVVRLAKILVPDGIRGEIDVTVDHLVGAGISDDGAINRGGGVTGGHVGVLGFVWEFGEADELKQCLDCQVESV